MFGGVAIAGTRARKQRTMSFNAFISVNYPPIAYIRNDRIVRNGLHGTHQGENPVCVKSIIFNKLRPFNVIALPP